MKILIIEDDKIQATTLKIKLSDLGYDNVTVITNLNDNLNEINTLRYDLLFCDVLMDGINGITLLSKYLNPKTINGVIISSCVENDVINLITGMCSLLKYQFVDSLQKPFEQEQLLNVINNYRIQKKLTQQNNNIERLNNNDNHELNEENIFLLYQPKYDFKDGTLDGLDVFVKYQHPELGIVSLDKYISQSKNIDFMSHIYQMILDKATLAITSLGQNIKLSISITKSLLYGDIYFKTVSICNKNNFPLNMLILEIAKDELYNQTPESLENIAQLRLQGVGISIANFGIGYASLEQLADLPLTELKIAKPFISKIHTSYKHQQLTEMVLNLAHSLGVTCVATGVDDKETWEYLKELGVDLYQGSYTGEPASITDISTVCSISQKSNQHHEIAPIDHNIAIFDKNIIRRKSISKLLGKLFSESVIVEVSSINELLHSFRDTPIKHVIIESDVIDNFSDQNMTCLLELEKNINCYVLSEHADHKKLYPDFSVIKKSSIVKDTVHHLVNAINDKNKRSQVNLLSKRELAVAQLLIAGFTNKYIAYELEISQKTVSTYKTRILQKLNVTTTLELSTLMTL